MKTKHTAGPVPYHGLVLVKALREEADEIALDNRAELVRNAANEIESLIAETKSPLIAAAPTLLEALEALLRNRDAAEAYIRTLEGKEEFDGAGNALPCDSPECEQARSALALARDESAAS